MAKDFQWMEDSNRSANPSNHEISDPARRVLLRAAGGGSGWGEGQTLVKFGVAAVVLNCDF